MTKTLWHTKKSPFSVRTIPIQEDKNILQDWNRLDGSPIYIDGRRVQDIIKEEKNLKVEPAGDKLFASMEELKDFLIRNLLRNVPNDIKEDAVEILMEMLHQGNLQRPVSSAAYSLLDEKSDHTIGPFDVRQNKPNDLAQERSTEFKLTANGFQVRENLTQYKCGYNITHPEKAGEEILPDAGKKFVYKAEAIIDLNFSYDHNLKEGRWPAIKLLNNSISYGNKQIQSLLDERTFFEKVVDMFKTLFRVNATESWAHQKRP